MDTSGRYGFIPLDGRLALSISIPCFVNCTCVWRQVDSKWNDDKTMPQSWLTGRAGRQSKTHDACHLPTDSKAVKRIYYFWTKLTIIKACNRQTVFAQWQSNGMSEQCVGVPDIGRHELPSQDSAESHSQPVVEHLPAASSHRDLKTFPSAASVVVAHNPSPLTVGHPVVQVPSMADLLQSSCSHTQSSSCHTFP